MGKLPFAEQSHVKVRALFLGHRIDIRPFKHTARLAATPLTVTAGSAGCVIIFRYGVVVMFGLNSVEEASFLAELKPLVVDHFEQVETEELELVAKPDSDGEVEQSLIYISALDVERVQLVAEILSRSVVLAHYEARIAKDFDRIEPLAENLRKSGRKVYGGTELLYHIAETLLTHGKMVGRVQVEEKPEVLWEHPDLERLYLRLEDEYEIRERHVALERKLDLISRTAETLLGLLQNNRSLRVEWYIVILIVVEILITLTEKFFVFFPSGNPSP